MVCVERNVSKLILVKALYTDPDGNKYLKLDPSWTKGKVGRTIPIRNESQIHAIENAKVVAGRVNLLFLTEHLYNRENTMTELQESKDITTCMDYAMLMLKHDTKKLLVGSLL